MHENLQLGLSPLTGKIFLGRVSKSNPELWLDGKRDVTSMFIAVMLQKFEPGTVSDIKVNGVIKYKVTIEEKLTIK